MLERTLLALQVVNPSLERLNIGSKESLHLRSTLRLARDMIQTSTHMLQEGKVDSISMVSVCVLSRAGAILVTLIDDYGILCLGRDLEELCFSLRRLGERWTMGRTHVATLIDHQLILSRHISASNRRRNPI